MNDRLAHGGPPGRRIAYAQSRSKRYLNMDLMRDQDIDKALELAEAV